MTNTSPRWMSPPPVYDAHSPSAASSTLQPYLRLPHLLSLTWLAYPILSLVFVIFRLQLSLASSEDAVASAKNDLLASCKAAEQAATAAASMPRYLAIATNEQFADAVNGSMDAAQSALVLSLTVMEAIIDFIIDTFRSTLLCFVELVVRGGLAILISAVQEITSFVQSTASSLASSIQSDIQSANSAIQTAISGINKVNPFGNITPPQITVPSLSSLQNITLPSDFVNALLTLNSSIPSFSTLKSDIDNIVNTPFELLKQDINSTFANLTFDSSILPVPELNTLTFCDNLDTSVVDDLGRDLIKVAKIGTIILVILALLLLAANCALEWYKWRCLKRHLRFTREAWAADPTLYHSGNSKLPTITLSDHNLMMLQADGTHPLLTRIAFLIASTLHLSPSKHSHLRWFFHYVFHPPALACFLIGFFGLLSVQLQLIAIQPLEAKYSAQVNSSVSDLSGSIAASINNSMFNQSAAYASNINGRVDVIQSSINNGLFGWVNITTTTLNDTINEFYNDVQGAVSLVFNGTILETPAQDFIKCILGTKVDAIEDALTFLNQNLQINMPRVNESILVLSPSDVNEATQPIAAAAVGGGSNGNQGFVERLVNTYAESLRKERVMFGVFMGLWAIVVLMAVCIILWHSYGHHLVEAHRRRKWQREQRSGIDDIVIPFRSGQTGGEKVTEKHLESGLPDLTPLPSPRLPTFQAATDRTSDSPPPFSKPRGDKSKRTWEDFFARLTGSSKQHITSKDISKPSKLMAIGFNSEAAGPEVQTPTSWTRRMTGLFRKNDEPVFTKTDAGSFRDRAPNNLRISVDRASNHNKPAVQVRNEPPKSAWSVSTVATNPTPRTQSIPPLPRFSVNPKPHLSVTLPRDEISIWDNLSSQVLKPTAFPVPLHHGFERTERLEVPTPIVAQAPVYPKLYNHLAPPTDKHRRSLSVPASVAMNEAPSPISRLLTTTHARKSSLVDPFATPFDDVYAVGTGKNPTNPFAAVAI